VLFELVAACGNQICGRHWVCEIRQEECGKHDVEREDRLDAMCHIEWQVACHFSDHHVVSLECEWCDGQPAGSVAVSSFDEGLSDGIVLVLNDAICL
jgi:hypothetical protein